MEAATRDYQGQALTGNGMTAGVKREAANSAQPPESSAAVNAICRLIREQQLWPEDVIALINAVSCMLAGGANRHLALHQHIVTELDQLSDSITAVVSGEAEVM